MNKYIHIFAKKQISFHGERYKRNYMTKSIKSIKNIDTYYDVDQCIFFNNILDDRYYIYSFYLKEIGGPNIVEISKKTYEQEKTAESIELLVTSVEEISSYIIELEVAARDALRPLGSSLKINDIKIPKYLLDNEEKIEK